MPLLPLTTIFDLQQRAVQGGLANHRNVLLSALDPNYVSTLEVAAQPASQLMLDLAAMNQVPEIVGGVTPLHIWLLTAASLSAAFPDRQRFYRRLADEVAKAVDAQRVAPSDAAAAAPVVADVPQRYIFKNDLLPASFLLGLAATARSVARIVVPQIEGGAPRIGASGDQRLSYGTAWLIGPSHVMTNWHVIEARAPGEPPPADGDIRLQAEAAWIEFDYDSLDAPPLRVDVAELAHGDRRLDYAVLRLDSALADRRPLALFDAAVVFDPAEPFPVNVVQHPGAGPKQFGIRNNAVAALRDQDLAYFTDTAGGSSGSPVCDDRWRVVALHKASTQRFGQAFNYQGKDSAWINVGTLIRPIVKDLRDHAATVWTAIGATLV